MSSAEFYKMLVEMVDAGKATEAQQYLTEHILEFPEPVQDSIMFAFFNEALQEYANKKKGVSGKQPGDFDAAEYLATA